MKSLLIFALCYVSFTSSLTQDARYDHQHDGHKMAEVILLKDGDKEEMGKVIIHWDGKETTLRGQVKGLKKGLHGFHVHEKGDLSKKCMGAGAHFNPEGKHHGAPTDVDRHVGDLGNIEAGPDGIAPVAIKDKLVTLDGPHDVTGKAIVVHADADDLGRGGHEDSLTTGHAGARVACGIIKPIQH